MKRKRHFVMLDLHIRARVCAIAPDSSIGRDEFAAFDDDVDCALIVGATGHEADGDVEFGTLFGAIPMFDADGTRPAIGGVFDEVGFVDKRPFGVGGNVGAQRHPCKVQDVDDGIEGARNLRVDVGVRNDARQARLRQKAGVE